MLVGWSQGQDNCTNSGESFNYCCWLMAHTHRYFKYIYTLFFFPFFGQENGDDSQIIRQGWYLHRFYTVMLCWMSGSTGMIYIVILIRVKSPNRPSPPCEFLLWIGKTCSNCKASSILEDIWKWPEHVPSLLQPSLTTSLVCLVRSRVVCF